jgi:hypothetical protein
LNLLLVPITEEVWTTFRAWYQMRGLQPPDVRPERGIFVRAHTGVLVAGCCLYTTDGPWFLVEEACANPAMPMRMVHLAALAILEQIHNYAAMTGKKALCLPSTQGLLGLMRANGFYDLAVVPVWAPPLAPTGLGFELRPDDSPQAPDVPVEKPKLKRKRGVA